jgi:hypothetical protein
MCSNDEEPIKKRGSPDAQFANGNWGKFRNRVRTFNIKLVYSAEIHN